MGNLGKAVASFMAKHWQKFAAGGALVITNFLTFGFAKKHYERKLASVREALRRHEEMLRSAEHNKRERRNLERECKRLRAQVKKYEEKLGVTRNG